jgi:hypothetical protein
MGSFLPLFATLVGVALHRRWCRPCGKQRGFQDWRCSIQGELIAGPKPVRLAHTHTHTHTHIHTHTHTHTHTLTHHAQMPPQVTGSKSHLRLMGVYRELTNDYEGCPAFAHVKTSDVNRSDPRSYVPPPPFTSPSVSRVSSVAPIVCSPSPPLPLRLPESSQRIPFISAAATYCSSVNELPHTRSSMRDACNLFKGRVPFFLSSFFVRFFSLIFPCRDDHCTRRIPPLARPR